VDAHDIRPAAEWDLAPLDAALARLSREIGDPHRTGVEELGRALFGTPVLAWSRVADGAQGLAGAVLFAPLFSTVRGGPGVFVSDLWVDPAYRGTGLGVALLGSAADHAGALWGAGFMRLSVHDENRRARDLYRRLGFDPVSGETTMVLAGQAFQQVRRTT
jgi:ribosomal protein S18 acetylase RimI-like enzyme